MKSLQLETDLPYFQQPEALEINCINLSLNGIEMTSQRNSVNNLFLL